MATIDMDWKEGGAAVQCIFRGELGPRLVQCGLGRGVLPYQVASSSIQPFGHNGHGQKLVGVGVPSFLRVAWSPSNTVAWAEAYLYTKCHLGPSSRLATTDIGQKLGWGLSPALRPTVPLYQVASWCIQPFSHSRNGPKIGHGGLHPLFGPCVRWTPSTPPQNGVEPPNFRPMFIVCVGWQDGIGLVFF